ncbi:MAG TPA: DUF1203 domain-containing protein [Rudaea sp.]|nr:DUF1203 domain-containing protein [Rudaea sp.]
MRFRITGLPYATFANLFTLTDEQLAGRGAVRRIAATKPGFPCRISLTDAEVGDEVILVHHEHHAVASPFRASHAIYVRKDEQQYDAVDRVPPMLRSRLLSVRAFDDAGMLVDADVVDGTALESLIERQLADAQANYLHIHFARPGCYAARVERA